MRRLRMLLRRLRGVVPSQEREVEFAAEIESHLQMHVDDNVRSGMTPREARRAAILALGGIEMTKQAYREQSTYPMVETMLQDLRFGGRQLRKNPGFAVTAILMLALGMCASVAIFAFVDAALIKPLPYAEPTRLVDVTEIAGSFGRANLSYPDYLDWKKDNSVFSSMAAYTGSGYMLPASAGSELVAGMRVTDNFFKTLGVTPVLGRDFYEGEDLPSAPRAVMLRYATWQKRYGGRKDVVGQAVTLSGLPYTIVGVLPESYQFARRNNAEFVAALHPEGNCDLRRSCHSLLGVARLRSGVTVEAARAQMVTIAQQLERAYPDSNREQGASVIALSEALVGDVRPILLTLLGGAGLLLVIACVNVASLLLVRSESRRREVAVRGALGASKGRLWRQFITEAVLLVAVGSGLGVVAAMAAMRLLMGLLSKDMLMRMPYLAGLGLNVRVVAFAGTVALLAAVVFSVTPMLRLGRVNIREGLAEGSRGTAGAFWRRMGSHLVVVELAIAMVLLVGAGLLGKSFYRLLHVDLGFRADHLATMSVSMPDLQYAKREQQVAIAREILGRVSALPGVKAVGTTTVLPVSFNGNTDWIRFVGRAYNGKHNEVNERDVSAGYLSTLQAKLVRGRYFTEEEDATKPRVAVINEALAKMYFPGEDPIGKRYGDTGLSDTSIREVVGVVEDVHESSLDTVTWPTEYLPFNQNSDTSFNLVVRTGQDAASVLPTIVAAIHGVDPGVATTEESTMVRVIDDSETASLHRSSAWLVGGFAGLALLLGVVGLYGVIAYSVSQRTREIGVRMALGAQRGTVYGMVLKEAGRLTGMGIVAGMVCAVGAATLMRTLLFGTAAWDVSTLVVVGVVLGVCAMVASYLPARRAAMVNPVEALRAE
jgi:macrolide transport system ATP-binding/permease protein